MSNHIQTPSISVIIPVKNGLATLSHCLEGLLAQSMSKHLEIIVIDSGSSDGTLDLLENYPVRVHRISPDRFNHGDTRNLGVSLAQGQFVAMTVQDASPIDEHWLERMVRHFEDPRVAGVCGQQVVAHDPDNNPLQWFRPCTEPGLKKVWFAGPSEFERLSPAEQVALCGWDDVTAMYRRSVLLKLPFRRVSFAEDLIWARDALAHGHALVYDYSARVYHYHDQSFRFRFRRAFTILYHRYQHFGYSPFPWFPALELARCVYRVIRRKYCPSRRAHWLAYNISLIVADWCAKSYFWLVLKILGKDALERVHTRLCGLPPQASQSANSATKA
ncbi:MAG: glycosyltransferase family 2 protein [Verrucomicrobiota bacterium]